MLEPYFLKDKNKEQTGANGGEEITPEELNRQYIANGDRRGQEGDFLGALKEYKKAAELAPPSAQFLSRLAESYAANDQPYKAIEYYQRALHVQQEGDETEDLSEAHVGLGDLCCSFALSATAIRSYERAVRSRPQNPYFRWRLAVALTAVGLYEKALEQLLKVVDLAPDDAFYHFQIADLYLLMERFTDAILAFKKSVKLAPRDEYYRLRLGAALLRAQRTSEAVKHFEQIIRMEPENPSYHALLHYAQIRNGEHPPISMEVAMMNMDAYNEDFVKRIQKLSESPQQ